MKILELRFKNLNSLYGEWLIDFTAPEYVANGIFALTGTTGAGKSTILDAICLALYGATPRLGKITRSANEIMSRRTGECYAEVLFESQTGRFRCHWEQRRARKKADGKLQEQEHQISDETTGKPIETKKSLVVRTIEDKTGMDFDRFTRSILLAQGGFDTFLKADAEQKSKILEQITGTEIYSEISRRVHERQRAERDKLNLLQAETSGIVILDQEQENEIQLKLELCRKQETGLAAKAAESQKAITWLNTVVEMKKELNNLAEEATILQKDIESFKPERNRLDCAIKAASLEGAYAALTSCRKQQFDDQARLKEEEHTLPKLETSAREHGEYLKSAEGHTIKAKKVLEAAAPLIRKIRALDQKLAEQEKAVSEGEELCRKDQKKIEQNRQSRLKELENRAKAQKELAITDLYLKENSQDEWLISGLAGIEEQMSGLRSRRKEVVQTKNSLEKADTALRQAAKTLSENTRLSTICRQELEVASKKLQQGRDALSSILGDRLLREYRGEKERLLREMTLLARIAELEDHRAKLENGTPCPLCGSTVHPFAEGNVPTADVTETRIEQLSTLIAQAEAQETANRFLEESAVAAANALVEREKLEAAAASEKKAAEKAQANLKEGLDRLQALYADQKKAISKKLLPFGISEIPDVDINSVLESLRLRMQSWQDQKEKKNAHEKRIAEIDSEIKRLDAIIEAQSNSVAEQIERVQILKKQHTEDTRERKNLYADKKVDEEENRLLVAVEDAEQREKNARTKNIELLQQLTSIKTHVESLKKRIALQGPELEKAATDFSSALEPLGFHSEKHFLDSRLTAGQKDALSARAKELDDALTSLKARQKAQEVRLRAETDKKLTDKTIEELKSRFKEHEEALNELRETIAGLIHRQSENKAAKGRMKEKLKVVDAQKKECGRWEMLHVLIGSADGKKYRNFAQGLTFELMVAHANRQLEKMTARYLLIRDRTQPLELNVVDSYQAGEIRSTRNLSGGESFIVSMTLALGLSKMASRKVRVDSLFLDEGFGSLDEEALETALETLSGLHQDGKLIGIISHVPAIKERINTQIDVTSVGSGKSTLTGPGCRNL